MKTNKLKIALAAMMFISACFSSFAQDVDGISIWDTYTKDQLVQKYGRPVFYNASDNDSPEEGKTESIRFNDVWFLLDNNHVVEFSLVSNKARALTKTIEGGIRIGDDVSVLIPIKDYYDSDEIQKDGVTKYCYWLDRDEESYVYVNVKNNKIVAIWTYTRTI